jgi:hypothetical protein
MTTRFEDLNDILDQNPRIRDLVIQEDTGKEECLSEYNDLISFFIPAHRDELIAKIKDTNDLNLFLSLISELHSAKIFAEKGCDIKLLPNDYFPSKSPDILCQYHDLSFYVEVTSLSNSDPVVKVIDAIRKLVHENQFVVNVHFNDTVSTPCFCKDEHNEQRTLLEKSLEQFKDAFEQLTPESTIDRIDTDCITFFISPSPKKAGILVGLSSGYKFPKEIFEKFVTELLLKKAIKREKFGGPARNFPYILAFVTRNIAVDETDFQQLLYGFVPTLLLSSIADTEEIRHRERKWEEILQDKNKHIPRWQEIEAAARHGWEDYLTKIHYIPNNYTSLVREGLFLSEPSMRNVSGILLIRKSKESHFYPNPFCDQEISLVNYQDFFNSFNLINTEEIVKHVFLSLKKDKYIDEKRQLKEMDSGDCYCQTAGTETINFNRNCSVPNDRRFIEFYLLHEEGHKRQKNRSYFNVIMLAADMILSCLIAIYLLPSSTHFEGILKVLVIFGAMVICSIFIVSRMVYKKEEFEADFYAAQCLKEIHNETKTSEIVRGALRFITVANANSNPVPQKYVPLYRIYYFINNTYPTLNERVENVDRHL